MLEICQFDEKEEKGGTRINLLKTQGRRTFKMWSSSCHFHNPALEKMLQLPKSDCLVMVMIFYRSIKSSVLLQTPCY